MNPLYSYRTPTSIFITPAKTQFLNKATFTGAGVRSSAHLFFTGWTQSTPNKVELPALEALTQGSLKHHPNVSRGMRLSRGKNSALKITPPIGFFPLPQTSVFSTTASQIFFFSPPSIPSASLPNFTANTGQTMPPGFQSRLKSSRQAHCLARKLKPQSTLWDTPRVYGLRLNCIW